MLWLLVVAAHAAPGRLAVGMSGAAGATLAEPSWRLPGVSSGVGCLGLVGWWITGGHDYAGSRGQVKHTADDHRFGLEGALCPTASGGVSGGAGLSYGRQGGGSLYFTHSLTLGATAYGKLGPADERYAAFGPYAKPSVRVGLALPPGMSVEAGPYLWFAPPLLQVIRGSPRGASWGHVGLEATFLVGAASPQVPWRH